MPAPLSLNISSAWSSSILLMLLKIFLSGMSLSGNACFMEFMLNSSTINNNGVITSIVKVMSLSTSDSNSISFLRLAKDLSWLSWSTIKSSKLIFLKSWVLYVFSWSSASEVNRACMWSIINPGLSRYTLFSRFKKLFKICRLFLTLWWTSLIRIIWCSLASRNSICLFLSSVISAKNPILCLFSPNSNRSI